MSASKTRSANYSKIKLTTTTTIIIGGALPLPFAINQFTVPSIQNSNSKRYSITQQFTMYMFASESERRNEIYKCAFNCSTAINLDRKVGKHNIYYNNGTIMSLRAELRVLSSHQYFT